MSYIRKSGKAGLIYNYFRGKWCIYDYRK